MSLEITYTVSLINKLFRKGNHGTLAYDIGTLNQRLIVMWTSGKLQDIHVYYKSVVHFDTHVFPQPETKSLTSNKLYKQCLNLMNLSHV